MPPKAKKNADAKAAAMPAAALEIELLSGEPAATTKSDPPEARAPRKKRAKKSASPPESEAAIAGPAEGVPAPAQAAPAAVESATAEAEALRADTFEEASEEAAVPEPVAEPAPKKRAARKKKVAAASPEPAPVPVPDTSSGAAADEDSAGDRVRVSGSVHDKDEAAEEAQAQPPGKPERLQKILAAAGIASRRHAEELITEGRVQVNGKVVNTLGSKADPARDHIRVDGKLLQGAERLRYFVLNKPRGYVTTVSDPEGRPTVMEFFSKIGERLYPVGRLDFLSEGLLIMTNDGELANKLTRAAAGVEKTYLVKVSGQPGEELLDRLREGLGIDRGRPGEGRVHTAPAQIRQVRAGENPWFEVVLIEGRNRELRKMFEEIGHFVEKIRRVGYGPLVLDVEPGQLRELDPGELRLLNLAADGKWKPKRVRTSSMLPKEAGRSVDHEGGGQGGRRPFRQGGPQRGERPAQRDQRGPQREAGRAPGRKPDFGRGGEWRGTGQGAGQRSGAGFGPGSGQRPGQRSGPGFGQRSGSGPRSGPGGGPARVAGPGGFGRGGDRPQRLDRPIQDRPQRPAGERPFRAAGKFESDRPRFEKRPFGDRPAPRGQSREEFRGPSRGQSRDQSGREGGTRTFGERGERPGAGDRGGQRFQRPAGSDRPVAGDRSGQRFDRPARPGGGGVRNDRAAGSDRRGKSFGQGRGQGSGRGFPAAGRPARPVQPGGETRRDTGRDSGRDRGGERSGFGGRERNQPGGGGQAGPRTGGGQSGPRAAGGQSGFKPGGSQPGGRSRYGSQGSGRSGRPDRGGGSGRHGGHRPR